MEVRSHQGLLELALRKIFPSHNIHVNVKKEAVLRSTTTGRFRELDAWLPDLNLAFEFQDAYHYSTTWFSNVTLASIQQKDNFKRDMVLMTGSTLIVIPCWWNGSINNLVATVLFHRPDLQIESFEKHLYYPISLNPSFYYFKGEYIPGIGELMLASFPEIGEFRKSISFTNSWWMGEKYDGVRFCWNSDFKRLYTRSGMEFTVPHSTQSLPNIYIDGELWMGRGNFSSAQKLVYTNDAVVDWVSQMVMFDVPSYDYETHPFELRYQALMENVSAHHPLIVLAPRSLCYDRLHLQEYVKGVMEDHGEGIILRRPASLYVRGRSPDLLKLKASRGDHEAIVVNVDKHEVELKLPDSTTYIVPTSNVEVSTKLSKGDIVSLYYEKFSRASAPVAPKIFRIRKDITWNDVLQSAKLQQLNVLSSNITKMSTKPGGKRGKALRNTLEKIARAKNLDPLNPQTWYNFSRKELIKSVQPNSNIFRALTGGYKRTIASIFPEIGINIGEFANSRTWGDIAKRRKWFESYAKKHNFDPLIVSNWFNSTIEDPTIIPILNHYSGDLAECLHHLFPELHFNETDIFPSSYWKDERNRRKFFEKYAEKEGFDPLIASNWYSTEYSSIKTLKGADEVLKYYRGSSRKALMELFREIGLEYMRLPTKFFGKNERRAILEKYAKSKRFDPLIPNNWAKVTASELLTYPQTKRVMEHYGGLKQTLMHAFGFEDVPTVVRPKYYWRNQATRKKFFEEFASGHGFDPNNAENWYKFTRAEIMKDPNAGGVLNYYGGSVSQALADLFPDIGLDPSKFYHLPRNYWNDMHNVKSVFEQCAKEHNFNPLIADNWYKIQTEDITKIKGGWTVLRKYNNSVSQALMSAFPDIELKLDKFNRLPQNYWTEFNNARSFLEQFAKEHNFDPLVPQNWSSVSYKSIQKACKKRLMKDGSIRTTLKYYFPELDWGETIA